MEKTAHIQLFMNMERCVHSKIATLVKNLHDGCWLAHDDMSTVVLCPRGVRQGCESGPIIFNSIYQLATEAVKDKLRDEGIQVLACFVWGVVGS